MDSCFYEVLSTIQFNVDVEVKDVQYGLARLISSAMNNEKLLKELHSRNCFKPYTFCSPYPLEKEKIYHKGRMYCFNLRTPDLKFALAMKKYLPIAKGVAIGSSSHAIGTAKAMEMGSVEGAMSGLSIVVCGILTVIGASVFAYFL